MMGMIFLIKIQITGDRAGFTLDYVQWVMGEGGDCFNQHYLFKVNFLPDKEIMQCVIS